MITPRNINPSDYKISKEALYLALLYDRASSFDQEIILRMYERSFNITIPRPGGGEIGSRIVSLDSYRNKKNASGISSD